LPTRPDYRQTLHHAVIETAEAVIGGTLGPVDAARRFVGLAAELDALDDEDFRFFVELDSQTDHFPLGPVREHWSAGALEREDRACREFEADVREEASSHCRSLLTKYTKS
jgi:hypothetical protein